MKDKPSCRIYLVRHGETANAAEVCFNGHFDVDLSAKGREQMGEVAEALKKVPMRAVYSSDLRRTRDSALLVAGPHNLEPVSYPELRELSFGEWEGLSVREVNEKHPGQLAARLKDIETFRVEGGESFYQLQERVLPRFRQIVARHPADCIAIMSHGGVNRVILGDVLGIPIKNIFRVEQDYATVNIIQFYGDDPVVELAGGTHRHIMTPPHLDKKISIQ
ncbi:MAG: alpha-ribazole phosphatase [Nitrospinaceae bacterium]